MTDDPLQVVFTPQLLEALDDRIARKVDETLADMLAIISEPDVDEELPLEAVV